jgi:homogentisate 1,2-dioxygenase
VRWAPEATDELAVMVDTFRPLDLGDAALACDDADYPWSWARQV